MLDQTLVSRCFKWEIMCLRKPVDEYFTAAECKRCISEVLLSLPDNDKAVVYEVIIKQETIRGVATETQELQTVIYWKSQE